jgi:hypothetical protein
VERESLPRVARATPRDGAARPRPAAHVLTLQRKAGNRATRRLLQRNGSAELLTKLATPQVFEGPEAKVQDEIVAALEAPIIQLSEEEQKRFKVTNVGGFEITKPVGSLSELLKDVKLVPLPDAAIPNSTFDIAKDAGVLDKIVLNTLHTMEAAGQLEYLRRSKLIDSEWKVVVEIHYYRDREAFLTKFHKDTRGETLFVNLNFVNTEDVPGPEFVINPATNETYEKYVEQHLPATFVKDLKTAKDVHGDPGVIGATVIPPKGVVSFVDEAIHHKTPTRGHRTASAGAVAAALAKHHRDEWADVEQAYKAWKARYTDWWSFESYLKTPATKKDAAAWLKIATKLENLQARFNRVELAEFLPDGLLDIDVLIEEGGSGDFSRADFLHAKTINVPVKKPGRPPLKRQMSEMELKGAVPKPKPGRRTFFRTWVRAVRR